MIIANADSSTRRACTKVSSIFYDFCQEAFLFSNDLTKFEAFAQSQDLRIGNFSLGLILMIWVYLLSRTRIRDTLCDRGMPDGTNLEEMRPESGAQLLGKRRARAC